MYSLHSNVLREAWVGGSYNLVERCRSWIDDVGSTCGLPGVGGADDDDKGEQEASARLVFPNREMAIAGLSTGLCCHRLLYA